MVATLPESEPAVRYAARDLARHYAQAGPERVDRGRRWYDAARREARSMARDTGHTLSQAAAVIAITSPDAQLSTNLEWARAILDGSRPTMAGRYPKDQAPKVRAALADRRPGRHATGPKVSAFYRAIMGNDDVLVIDRWASYAAGGPRDVPAEPWRRTFETAYRRAADACGETVRDFQAIVWIQVRETSPDARGRVVSRSDIV